MAVQSLGSAQGARSPNKTGYLLTYLQVCSNEPQLQLQLLAPPTPTNCVPYCVETWHCQSTNPPIHHQQQRKSSPSFSCSYQYCTAPPNKVDGDDLPHAVNNCILVLCQQLRLTVSLTTTPDPSTVSHCETVRRPNCTGYLLDKRYDLLATQKTATTSRARQSPFTLSKELLNGRCHNSGPVHVGRVPPLLSRLPTETPCGCSGLHAPILLYILRTF